MMLFRFFVSFAISCDRGIGSASYLMLWVRRAVAKGSGAPTEGLGAPAKGSGAPAKDSGASVNTVSEASVALF